MSCVTAQFGSTHSLSRREVYSESRVETDEDAGKEERLKNSGFIRKIFFGAHLFSRSEGVQTLDSSLLGLGTKTTAIEFVCKPANRTTDHRSQEVNPNFVALGSWNSNFTIASRSRDQSGTEVTSRVHAALSELRETTDQNSNGKANEERSHILGANQHLVALVSVREDEEDLVKKITIKITSKCRQNDAPESRCRQLQ